MLHRVKKEKDILVR